MKSEQIARKASEALLRAVISETRTKKVRMEQEIDTCTVRLRELMCEEKLTRVKEWCSAAAKKSAEETRTRQMSIFEKLRSKKLAMSLDPKRVVVNISKITFTEDEERVLTLGLNFATAPKQWW